MSHRFTLKPYTKIADRETCPACGKKNCFSPYIDTETGEPIGREVGRCNREDNCGHHLKPKEFFEANPDKKAKHLGETKDNNNASPRKRIIPTIPIASTINDDIFKSTLGRYEINHFVQFLYSLLPVDKVNAAVAAYQIGTSRHWKGATTFWYISMRGEMRSGKIMLYDQQSGRRVKHPYNYVTWVHTVLKIAGFQFDQPLYGEHLLSLRPDAPIGLVESEKTAVIASIFLPDIIWLACGGLKGLNLSKCAPLVGRQVTLFPDLGKAYEEWKQAEQDLSHVCTISTSGLLERLAIPEERVEGLDLADYLLRVNFDVTDPRTEPIYENRAILGHLAETPNAASKCVNTPTIQELREQFKSEWLQPEPLDEAGQYKVWREYNAKGLQNEDVKAVVMELINTHHFKVY